MQDEERLLKEPLGHYSILPPNALIKFIANDAHLYLIGLAKGVPIGERGRRQLENLGILISQAQSAIGVLTSRSMAGYHAGDMDCYAAMEQAGWYSTPKEAQEVLVFAKGELETALRGDVSHERLTALVNNLMRIPTEEPTRLSSRGWKNFRAMTA